uniref:Uncharacterized protein n=1 Tax=Palpitomonas bilix TaxID=652834 RepID=A0A7S3GBF4_9EUKA|mmetsp:Transcript_43204/g.112074  ORF Transcript_43204/g.112074 Transcript_43204/m.112074 type:complete len:113 (+) Transcript_43204:280-618(+)
MAGEARSSPLLMMGNDEVRNKVFAFAKGNKQAQIGSPIEHPHRPEPPSQPRRPASAKHVRSSGGGVRNKRRLLSARQRGQQESDVQRTEIVEAYASLPTSRLAVRVEHRGEH